MKGDTPELSFDGGADRRSDVAGRAQREGGRWMEGTYYPYLM